MTFKNLNRIMIKINDFANEVTNKLVNNLTMQNLQNNKQFKQNSIVYQQNLTNNNFDFREVERSLINNSETAIRVMKARLIKTYKSFQLLVL